MERKLSLAWTGIAVMGLVLALSTFVSANDSASDIFAVMLQFTAVNISNGTNGTGGGSNPPPPIDCNSYCSNLDPKGTYEGSCLGGTNNCWDSGGTPQSNANKYCKAHEAGTCCCKPKVVAPTGLAIAGGIGVLDVMFNPCVLIGGVFFVWMYDKRRKRQLVRYLRESNVYS